LVQVGFRFRGVQALFDIRNSCLTTQEKQTSVVCANRSSRTMLALLSQPILSHLSNIIITVG